MRKAIVVIFAAGAVAAVGGCASHSSWPPSKSLSLADALIVAERKAPEFDVGGLPGGKAGGAGIGAGSGLGMGALAGAAACLAAGPLAPLCLVAVVPATSAVGAVAGGVVGAVKTESVETIAFKTGALTQALGSPSNQTDLAQDLQADLNDTASLRTTLAENLVATASPAGAAKPGPADRLVINVAIVQIGTEGRSEFALRIVTRAQVRRRGETSVLYEVSKEVQSEVELTITQWMARDASALRAVMTRCLHQASRDMAVMLTSSPAVSKHAVPKYSTSCNDVEEDWKPAVTAQGMTGLPASQRFAVGDRWEWRQFDNRTNVEERRYTRAVLSTGDPLLFSEYPATATMAEIFVDGGYDRSQKPWRSWPLEVGKKWTFDGIWHRPDGASGNTRQEVEVVAYEEVVVPAGTFMAFKIEAHGFYRNAAGGGARQNDTYWYASDANCDVKHVRQDDRNSYTRELVSYGRGPAGVTPKN